MSEDPSIARTLADAPLAVRILLHRRPEPGDDDVIATGLVDPGARRAFLAMRCVSMATAADGRRLAGLVLRALARADPRPVWFHDGAEYHRAAGRWRRRRGTAEGGPSTHRDPCRYLDLLRAFVPDEQLADGWSDTMTGHIDVVRAASLAPHGIALESDGEAGDWLERTRRLERRLPATVVVQERRVRRVTFLRETDTGAIHRSLEVLGHHGGGWPPGEPPWPQNA